MRVRLALLCLALVACSKDEKKDSNKTIDQRAQAVAADGGHPSIPQRTARQVPPPFDVVTPPADAEKLPDGLVFQSITEGTGGTPSRNDGVKIKYSAWRPDGTTFATTEPATQPTTMWLFTTAPGFAEAVMKLKVGGKAMFWVPPALGLAAGKAHGKNEQIAYEVELVDIVPAPATPPDVAAPPGDAKKEKSGVSWTFVKHAAKGADAPKAWDDVAIAYTGWDTTGKIVDSSEVHGKPVTMPVDKLPPVFADVIPTLAVGDRVRLWFPGDMLGKGPGAPQGQLCFEVEMSGVTHLAQPPPTPPDVAKPPADALKTPKGVFYKVLTKGTGTVHPTTTDQVTVNYTGWTTDGKRFDSSIPKGKPSQFRTTGVIAGWTDALMMMVVGDKWRVWIPQELAYAGAPNRPQGMLVFDVELMSVDPLPVRPTGPGPAGVPHPPSPTPPKTPATAPTTP